MPPGEILAHAGLLQCSPLGGLGEQIERSIHSVDQGLGAGVLETDPRGCRVGKRLALSIDNCIGQSAYLVHDRYGAVAHAVELIQPTGFEA